MKTYNNKYIQQINSILLPILGEFMTEATIKNRCEKISKNVENIDVEDLNHLADSIKIGLIVFIGTEKANEIAEKIRKLT
jgi:hypothetical protein